MVFGFPKQERKRLQIEHAVLLSLRAGQIKIADKISNVRDVTHFPPGHWAWRRRSDYLDWAEQVVANLRGANLCMEDFSTALSRKAEACLPGFLPREPSKLMERTGLPKILALADLVQSTEIPSSSL